jgi:hypothetical protein
MAKVKYKGKWGFIDETGREVIPPVYKMVQDFSEGMGSFDGKGVEKNDEVSNKLQSMRGYTRGYINKNGKEVIPSSCGPASSGFSGGLARVERPGNKWGYLDATGKEVVPVKYDAISLFQDGLAAVKFGNKWGFVDTSGNEAIAVQYDAFAEFDGELVIASIDGKWGFIDRTGKEVIAIKYDDVIPFSEGLAAVCLNQQWGYVDMKGQEVVAPKYSIPALNNILVKLFIKTTSRDLIANAAKDDAQRAAFKAKNFASFSNGMAAVYNGSKWGFINAEGQEVVELKYDEVRLFSDDIAAVKSGGLWGFVDRSGNEVIATKYNEVKDFSEGLAGIKLNNQWGFTDKTGKEVIPFKYNEVLDFSEGLAGVGLNRFWGFIDKEGKEVVALKYAQVCDFSEGVAAVGLDKRWGFIDRQGFEITPLIYVKPFGSGRLYEGKCSDGLIPVCKGNLIGFINKKGEQVIPYQYTYASNFSNGYAVVGIAPSSVIPKSIYYTGNASEGFGLGLIDKDGNVVVPPTNSAVGNLNVVFTIVHAIFNAEINIEKKNNQMDVSTVFSTLTTPYISIADGKVCNGSTYIPLEVAKYTPKRSGKKWGFVDKNGNPLEIHP